MATVILENVNVDFPIYGAQQRSLHKAIFTRATGGSIKRDGKNQDRVTVKALSDISLTLHDGDRLGLIGHNGSGKSTLLKLIAGIYQPVSGHIEVDGRVTPLFDTMPGLDGEDSGYENIITSGMLIGMTRDQIEAKIPEIEEFCELGEYLSLPVRTYSTGMTMRLGFALVTALEPGVLLMDEGFGTGDLRFAEKAQARMNDFIGRSRIMVLASHSDNTIRSMCNKAVLMESGRIVAFGPVDEICNQYYHSVHASNLPSTDLAMSTNRQGTGAIKFTGTYFLGEGGEKISPITGASCDFVIEFARNPELSIKHLKIAVGIDNSLGQRVTMLSSDLVGEKFEKFPAAAAAVKIHIHKLPLLPGTYRFTLFISIDNVIADWVQNAGEFEVMRGDFFGSGVLPPSGQGSFVFDYDLVPISKSGEPAI